MLLTEYDRVMSTWSSVGSRMQESDWSEVFDRQALQMQLVAASWRKDLSDYGEKIDVYVKGFIDARGILSIAVLDVPDEQKHKRKLMEVALKDGLEDVISLLEQALSRWQRELRENIGTQLASFQRDLRTEANTIREQVFHPIFRLEAAL